MTRMIRFVPRTDTVIYSRILEHTISGLTDHVIATLDFGGKNITLGSIASTDSLSRDVLKRLDYGQAATDMIEFSAIPLGPSEIEWLNNYSNLTNGYWQAYVCRFTSGLADRIVIRVGRDKNQGEIKGFLSTIWPVLREDCLCEARHEATGAGEKALLWMISDKIDVGVLVMKSNGLMLKSNAAAKTFLDNGNVLRRSRHGIRGIDEKQTRLFRESLTGCAGSTLDKGDKILFLETAVPGRRSPVILSHFMHEGEPTGLVTVLLPAPPEPRRVEMLAKKMGLTQAEARVAALLQTGLSNRDAAKIAGLQEQSFSTYAKRVLSKLNVRSRAEMAQLLTWQARGGGVPTIR